MLTLTLIYSFVIACTTYGLISTVLSVPIFQFKLQEIMQRITVMLVWVCLVFIVSYSLKASHLIL